MNKEEIYFVEPFMTGSMHAPFNVAMLQVMLSAYPDHKQVVFMQKNYFRGLAAYGFSDEVCFHPITVVDQRTGNKLRWFIKHLLECWVLTMVLMKATLKRPLLVYFSFLSPPAQYLASLYSRYIFRKTPIFIQLHGLDILKPGQATKQIDKQYVRFLKRAFKCAGPRKYYIVLEQSAQTYLAQLGYLQKREMIHLPHPYTFNAIDVPTPTVNKKQPLIFAHLGVARLSKGSHLFFQLAATFAQEIKEHKIVFKVIGTLLPEMDVYQNEYVQVPHGREMLSAIVYNKAIQEIDYAVFCYGNNHYELTSSGAVMDAIAAKKPILSLQNNAFEYLFSIPNSPVGKLFDTMETMEQEIRFLLNRRPDTTIYQTAFTVLQQYFSITNIAEKMRKEVDKVIGILI